MLKQLLQHFPPKYETAETAESAEKKLQCYNVTATLPCSHLITRTENSSFGGFQTFTVDICTVSDKETSK